MEDNIQASGALPIIAQQPKKSGLSDQMKTIAANPQQTQSILQQMQQLIAERESPYNTFISGIKDATAWGAGGAEGPTQALAVRDRQKAEEAKQLFDMRTQIANLRSQEARQQAGAQALGLGQPGAMPGQFGAQGAGGAPAPVAGGTAPYMTMLRSLPPSVQPMGSYLLSQFDFDGFNKLVSEHELKRPSEQKNLQFASTLPPDQREIFMRQQFKEAYQPQKYVDASGSTFPFSLPQAMPPEMRQPAAPAAGAPNQLAQIQSSVFQTESSSGRADTTKPSIQGAVGPMQITPDTWKTNTDRGVIPKGLDINNPQHNKLAGDKILEYYYNKYNGDVDKTLAAYHGGEGAIKPDGTIDRNRKDANGVTIGQYIDKNKTQIGGAEPVRRRSESEIEREKIGSGEAVKKVGEEVGNIAKEVITLGKSANERETRYNDVVNIVSNPEMKKVFGVLAKNGIVPFVLKTLESGANIGQFGSLGIANLERNLSEAGASDTQIDALRRVEKHLKQAELEYARVYLAGQGAVSDAERRLVREAVGSTNDPAQILEMQARVMAQRAKFDAQMADAYEKYRTKFGTYADPDKFFTTQGKAIKEQHNRELGKILGVVGVKVPLDNDPLQAPPSQEEKQTPGKKAPLKNVPYKVIA